MIPSTQRHNLFLTLFALSAFIFAYFPVWKDLITAWSDSPENSHGFFIIPLFVYFLWRKIQVLSHAGDKEALQESLQSVTPAEAGVHEGSERADSRERFAETPPSGFLNRFKGSNWGLAIIIFSLLVYLFAHYAEIITLRSLSIIPLTAGIIIYFLGFAAFKELLFPIFLLFFMIPIPSQIYSQLTIPLQLFVSKVSVWAAALLGVPVFREGNVIHLSDKTLQVVRACSGMRSMVSLLALSAVFGYLSLRSQWLRLGLFLAGIPIAIIVNAMRVLVLILAYHYFALDLARGMAHTVLGLLVFAVAFVLLLGLKGVISPWDTSPAQS